MTTRVLRSEPLSAHRTAEVPVPATLPLQVTGLGLTLAGRALLTDVSFAVMRGSFSVILGPNGAGKSLLLRLCHGLLVPTAGRISWNGVTPERARISHAFVFQHPVLLRRSAAANIEYPLKVRRVPKAERQARVAEALRVAGMVHLARNAAQRLSGGEQQRLALARAWALRPEVLLLDEPSANLDPNSTVAVEQLIASMCHRGTTVIMTTHDLAQARRLADRVLLLHHGRVVEDGAATAFFSAPQSAEGRAFVSGQLLAGGIP